ncbi:MAG: DegT/DnrJ/EryC1/StrS family aminotransferase [Acidimicrobiales bacterium]
MNDRLPPPRIRLAHPDVGDEEIEAVTRVLRTPVLTMGPETEAFESEVAAYHGTGHGVALANGTVALIALFDSLGIGRGDEVIVPSLTFVSTVTSLVYAGAKPVFADVDPETFCVDPAAVERLVGRHTKAILAVHYGGQPADLAELATIATENRIVLLEDAAEAHGATYRSRHIGTWGAAAMLSFTPTKNITTGEGGMILTDHEDLARRLRLVRNHGQTAPYEHSFLGCNWRITEMQAAMGRAQLAKLDAILARKRALAAELDGLVSAIDGVEAPMVRPDRDHTHMLYTVRLATDAPGRDTVAHEMALRGIETKVYFPPVHRQPLFARTPQGAAAEARLAVTNDLAGRILSLPIHSRLTSGELAEIAGALNESMRAGRAAGVVSRSL